MNSLDVEDNFMKRSALSLRCENRWKRDFSIFRRKNSIFALEVTLLVLDIANCASRHKKYQACFSAYLLGNLQRKYRFLSLDRFLLVPRFPKQE